METLRQQFSDWKRFQWEVVGMWRREHGFTISAALKASPWLTVVGLLGILTMPEPYKTWSQYLFWVGLFVLLFSLCFVFPFKKWKQLEDDVAQLVSLRKTQREDMRTYIHPILAGINCHLDTIRDTRWGTIDLAVAFINMLTETLVNGRLTGKLHIHGLGPIEFEFDEAPRQFQPCTISSTFRKSIPIPEPMRTELRQLWEQESNKPSVKLTMKMEIPGRDPIAFDPQDEHPLHLSIGRGSY